MIETIDTLEGLAAIEEDWRRVGNRFPSPLLQHEWFMAGAQAFCPPEKLHVIVNRREGRITAIAPLSLQKVLAESRFEILGTGILCEPTGFIYETREDLEELLHYLIALKKPTHLRRLPAESHEAALLDVHNKGFAFQAERPSGSPWIPITMPWAEYEKTISSKDRYTLRRARKRADGLGQVAFDIRTPSPDDVASCFGELAAIEAKSWKEANGTSLGSYAPLNKFFNRYMRSAAAAGTLRARFLTISGAPVAFLLGVEYRRRFWVLKISFDESYAHCSPGVILMHEVIRRAFEADLEAFEFLGTDEQWLHVWTNDVRQYVGIHLYPFSLGGLINLGSDSSNFILSRIPGLKQKSHKD